MSVLVEPRPDGAVDVPVGGVEIGHRATSRVAGCASAMSAERSCRVAKCTLEPTVPTGTPRMSATRSMGQVQVVVQDHHRSMIQGKTAKGALELVAIDDRTQAIDHHRFVNRQQPQVRRPTTGLAALGIAGAHEEPIRPSLEAVKVAELGKVLPDAEQRLLRRVLGKVDVAQDPMRHGEEPIRDGIDQFGKRLLVSALCTSHEIGVHAPPQGFGAGWVPTLQLVWEGCGPFSSSGRRVTRLPSSERAGFRA